MVSRRIPVILVGFVFLIVLSLTGLTSAYGKAPPGSEQLKELKTYTSEQLNAALATLSDKEVRAALLAELEQEADAAGKKKAGQTRKTGLAGIVDHFKKFFEVAPQRIQELSRGIGTLPAEMGKYVDQVTHGNGFGRLILLLLGIAVIIGVSYGLERLLMKSMAHLGDQWIGTNSKGGIANVVAAILSAVPAFVGIMIFAVVSALLCLIILGSETPMLYLYGPILMVIIASRLLILVVRIVCTPQGGDRQFFGLDDTGARHLTHTLNLVIVVLVISWITGQWFKAIGFPADSYQMVNMCIATFILALLGWFVWINRTRVTRYISGETTDGDAGPKRLVDLFANLWHIFALTYLFWIWFAAISSNIIYGPNYGTAFLRALLVVPLYLILDRIFAWVIPSVLGATTEDEDAVSEEGDSEDEDTPVPVRTLRTRLPVIRALGRSIIGLALLVWLLEAYDIHLPFIAKVADGGFSILVTLVLALVAWRWLNNYVARKLEETAPPPSDEPADEEFGGVVLDRSHTLLPMLRKFIGTVLLIMVVMITLSSLGIDIGPLLAGAGVIGLAVGFGAQKLVSDVLSGFFYLMDDAFRVGEYIQAGSVSGTVEAITLRNVMMRHPRGALQIVPFSDLGTISNLMRGGMVIKFNIDLPYDTDIEKVRKIIKKVGKKMLADPAMADDFILPVKSQGVKSMGDSVMTFRVKFTAKPGKQFLIKREAFRRIKEALEAKGIYFANRKVIVELPESNNSESQEGSTQTPQQDEQLRKAGAAAAEAVISAEESKSKK